MKQVMLEDIEVKVWRSHIKIPMILLVPMLCIVSLYVMLYFGINSRAANVMIQREVGGIFGGDVGARELVIEPNLSRVHLYGGHLGEQGIDPLIKVKEIHLELALTGLLTRHVHVTSARAIEPDVYLHMDTNADMNLLRALGLYEETEDDEESSGEMPISLTFGNVSLEHGKFRMKMDEIFEIDIPEVNISGADLRISSDTLWIEVAKARAPRGDLRFYNELFGFPEEDGDWTFGVDDFQIDQWVWSNSGYTAERVSGFVEGYTVTAQGYMGFPDEGDDVMTWGGEGKITAPFWSSLVHYFVGETLHYSIPNFDVKGEGTINWVESTGELYADRVDAAGIQITDLRGKVALHDQMVEVIDTDFEMYGGKAHVNQAFFDMFELVYSGDLTLDSVDLAGLTEDFFELEAEYLKGEASGSLIFSGMYPEDSEYDPEKFTLYQSVKDKWVDLEFTTPVVVKRESKDIIPAEVVKIDKGATAWVDQDRAVVPNAKVTFDGQDVFYVTDLAINFEHYTFEPYESDWGGRVRGSLADTTRWIRYYEVEDVRAGVSSGDVLLRGDVLAPDVKGSMKIGDIEVGSDFKASSLTSTFDLQDGYLKLNKLEVEAPGGSAHVRGEVDLFRRTAEPDPEWEFIIYQLYERGKVELDIDTRNFDLEALSVWLPTGVDPSGRATVDATVRGRLNAILACSDVTGQQVSVYGEEFTGVRLKAAYRDPGVGTLCDFEESELGLEWRGGRKPYVMIEELEIDHIKAGHLSLQGRYGLDERLDLKLHATKLKPGATRYLSAYDLTGQLEAMLDIRGKVDTPVVSGSVRGRGLGVQGVKLGDISLVMDTLSREIEGLDGDMINERVVHVAGGLLPWGRFSMELPLNDDLAEELRAPMYARVDVQDFDVVNFVNETGVLNMLPAEDGALWSEQLEQLQRIVLSGQVEVFIPPAFDGLTVLVALDTFEFGPKRLGVYNQDPMMLSYRLEEGAQSVVFDSVTLGRGDHFISLGGVVSPDDGFVDVAVDGSLDLGVLIAAQRLFPSLVPEELVDIRGFVDVAATFQGEFEKLIADGSLTWHPTTVELRGLSEPLTIQDGVVEFNSTSVKIREGSPINGGVLGGVFSLSGGMMLESFAPKSFDFSLWTHNISYAVPEMVNVTLDTDLRLAGQDIEAVDSWKVSGNVEILDGLFYQNISVLERELTGRVLGAFNRRTEVYEASLLDEMPELEQLKLDVALKARDGFKLKNQIDRFGLDLEFRIDLHLANTIEDLSLTGDVDVIDGKVLFQGESFVVRTGTVRFSGDASKPYVDVVAVADIRNVCSGDSLQNDFTGALALNGAVTTTSEVQDETYQISLNVKGNADNINILYDAVPYADQRDIISLILTGCTVDLLTASSASQPTLETLLGPLIGRLEKEIQEVVRVEEFNITPGVNRTQLLISDDLTRRLSWRFKLDKAFNDANSTGQSGQLEYQLTDRWAAVLEESSYSDLNTSGRFQIDLKLKYRLPLD